MQANQQQHEVNSYATRRIKYKAKQLIGFAGFTECDRDDLEQEMMLDLLKRLPKYDESKAQKNTFIARVINRKISMLIRSRECPMRDYRREAHSLNEQMENYERGENIACEDLDRRLGRQSIRAEVGVDISHDMALVLAKLPDEMRRFCEILMTGTMSDAARQMNITRRRVSKYLKTIRKVFISAKMQKYL